MAIKAIINNTEKEIEQIKNSDEQDIDYVYSRIGDTEVEGAPPISIKSIGGNLSNYRIYGNTVNGESVGDLVTDSQSEHYGEYAIPITNNSEIANIYLNEPLRMVGDEAEYVDYGQQKQHRVRKNLWSGVVEQGGVSQLGDYVSHTKRIRSINVPLDPGTYAISTNLLLWVIYAFNDTQKIGLCASIYQGSYSYTITVPAGANNISIGMMKVVDGVQVDITPSDFEWGQIEKGSEATTYEPYIENTDLDVTLPALPTIKGTNTLSVNTSIQPSNMYIKDNFDYKKVFTATRAIEDGLPLSYRSIEDNDSALKSYRIYGNTASGESVGDLVAEGEHAGEYKVPVTVEGKNLCNNIWEQKMINVETGNTSPNENTVCCDFIPVKPNVTYSCSRTIANNYNNLRCYGTNKNYLGTGADLANKGNPLKQGELFGTFMITDARVSYIRFNDLSNSLDTKYMLVEGRYTAETMPPYEPYHAPVTTNIYLPEQIKMVGDEAEYIDFMEQKQHRVRKNLLQNTATSQTINGVTFTVNDDGSITCNGTATEITYCDIHTDFNSSEYAGMKATFYSDTSVHNALTSTVRISNSINRKSLQDIIQNNAQIVNNGHSLRLSIRITDGYTCNNLTFYPMIRKADITDNTYEPYIENTDLDVTLPALPTLSGTNTLSVGTEVQPSRVYLKGKIKEIN